MNYFAVSLPMSRILKSATLPGPVLEYTIDFHRRVTS